MLECVVGDLAMTASPRPMFFSFGFPQFDGIRDLTQTLFKSDAMDNVTEGVCIPFVEHVFHSQLERIDSQPFRDHVHLGKIIPSSTFLLRFTLFV